MSELQGRRVDGGWEGLEQPGDYSPLKVEDGNVGVLLFVLPEGTWGRIAGQGHGQNGEPEWTITEESDGTVTVSPSIDYPDHWHGFLKQGVWTW